jgi:tRNA(fMet)-specific endonuclease VapC
VGILADSTVMIAAERAGSTPRQVIADLIARYGDAEAALSVISVVELAHGIERAQAPARRTARERFLDEILSEIAVEPVTIKIAFRAGRSTAASKHKEFR